MTKQIAILSILIITLLTVSPEVARGGAGGPANDAFANAMELSIQNGNAEAIVNSVDSTKEPGEPNHAGNPGGRSVWFKITPTATTVVRINTMEAVFDTLLAVYTGDSVGNLQTIVFNDDCTNNCGGGSIVDMMLTAGTTYYIAVDGYNDSVTTGAGVFRLVVLNNGVPFQDHLQAAYGFGTAHGASIGGTNYAASREPGEPTHINPAYPGVKSVWYHWSGPSASTGTIVELTEDFDSQLIIYKTPVANPSFANLTRVTWNIDSIGDSINKYHVQFMAEPNFDYYFVVAGHTQNPVHGDSGNFQLSFKPAKMKYSMVTDQFRTHTPIGVYRPSEGSWYMRSSLGSSNWGVYQWGLNGDVPLAVDFTGDGRSDETVVRNENGLKIWYIQDSPVPRILQWGLASDKVVVGDFDADSRADMAVIRNSGQGFVWYIRRSSNGALMSFTFGTTGDRPILGDFDGDRTTDIAVLRNTSAGLIWWVLYSAGDSSHLPFRRVSATQFGQAPDVPAVEDFDGDGKTDIAVFRPSTGMWYIQKSSNGEVRQVHFGLSGDKPQPADYTGDGKVDLAVYRPSDGTWYIAKPNGVPAQDFHAVKWGIASDTPISTISGLSQ